LSSQHGNIFSPFPQQNAAKFFCRNQGNFTGKRPHQWAKCRFPEPPPAGQGKQPEVFRKKKNMPFSFWVLPAGEKSLKIEAGGRQPLLSGGIPPASILKK
jgi:hypothetical protein